MIFKREPALFLGLVQSVLALVCAFGLSLSTSQIGAVMAVSAAVLALVTRSRVTPTSKLQSYSDVEPYDHFV